MFCNGRQAVIVIMLLGIGMFTIYVYIWNFWLGRDGHYHDYYENDVTKILNLGRNNNGMNLTQLEDKFYDTLVHSEGYKKVHKGYEKFRNKLGKFMIKKGS